MVVPELLENEESPVCDAPMELVELMALVGAPLLVSDALLLEV